MFAATSTVILALAASALGNVFTTAPVASTVWTAGQQSTVSWQDDGTAPSLSDFGQCTIAIYVGNAQQQTPLQTIATNVDVSTTSTVQFTPDPTVGASGNFYFIRFTSNNLKDATQTQFPAEAFSAKFTINGMTGTFNSSVQSEIDGQSTAPIGGSSASGSTTAGSSATTTGAATTKLTTSSGTASKTSSSTASATNTSGATRVAFSGLAAVAAAAVLAVAFC